MAFKVTKWEGSEEKVGGFTLPEEGDRFTKITDAYEDETNPEDPIYIIECLDLHNEATYRLRYKRKGDSKLARANKGTLISLGKALAGVDIGVPATVDIVGGVVVAEIGINEVVGNDGKTRHYPRCYHFKAAPKDIVEQFADIEQYYEGSDDTTTYE